MLRLGWNVFFLLTVATNASASDATVESLSREFEQQIVPLVETHCASCHDSETREAGLDLTAYRRLPNVTESHRLWQTVLERVEAEEMPPLDTSNQLSESDRDKLVQWIRAITQMEANRSAGDPGVVLARRLSNAEYDYSIRDLTGVDIRPTQTFPVDPANEAGFDNSGESLSMSPALMKKYLEAARTVADHLVLTPAGIRFAPHPVVADTDRDKYCVKRIVEFYQRQPTDYADYFFAAWIYRHRDSLRKSEVTLEQIASEQAVSAKYLETLWPALSEEPAEIGAMVKLQAMWNGLPDASQRPQETTRRDARLACERMRDYVKRVRKQFEPHFENLHVDGIHPGSQAFVLWKNKQYAAHRRTADFGFLEDESRTDKRESAMLVELPAKADRERFIAACERFCSLFPDAFYISERGRGYLGRSENEQEKGRLLSAGFHSMMGYFRDDAPLYELILDQKGRRELDDLWQELDFVTAAPLRQYQGFLWFERTDSGFMRDPEFDFARPEDLAALQQPMIKRLGEVYLAKATERGGETIPLQAIRDYFREINQQIRRVEKTRTAAQPHHLDAILALAERAYRRPLTSAEKKGLRTFYHELRKTDELSHEEAIQDVLVSVLMSPYFLYRLDLLSDSETKTALDDYELASRLSYFLWSSLPDTELLQHAAAGDLHEPEVLIEQTRRMLRDERVRALATEFGGNWLDFRRFEEHNSVDRQRFPSFDDQLRSAMFEEPIRFLMDMIRHDRSTLDFLYADRTFVNAALAEHYGIDGLQLADGQWREISDASRYGRGGLLSMAVFLTKSAPGLRTSPIKRGYWVVRRLLGERIPPPPPNVPELPADESKMGELTLRQTLAKHRDHASCAGCHDRFDAVGLVFEGFGPIGERRTVDLGGRAVDTSATFPDGSQRDGVEELRDYLREQREADFVNNLCRKLTAYALGRTLQLSDEKLLQKVRDDSRAEQYRFGKMIEVIVTSPQFLNKRGRSVTTVVQAQPRDSQ